MSNTAELHLAIAKMQALMKLAASHVDDADIRAELEAAALPWDQRQSIPESHMLALPVKGEAA